MRILHTADWHVGKKLARIDRRGEFEQALDEVVSVAADQKVDIVVVAGDLLDRSIPPLDALRLVLDALIRLADAGGRVVAIPGNHDSPVLFELLAPLLLPSGVHLIPRIRRAEEGGVVEIASRDGSETAKVAGLPFLHEADVVDFMTDSEEWFKGYADRIRLLCSALSASFDPQSVGILVGHFFVAGAQLGGGERKIHLGEQYAATSQAIPPAPHYVALGHIHRPQAIPGAAVASRYSGSLLQLDFSERTHTKEVVIAEVKPGLPAKVTPIPLVSGRNLVRVEDTLESLRMRAEEFGDAYVDVRVRTEGPRFGLGEEVRSFLRHAVMVQAVYERKAEEFERAGPGGRPLHEVYSEYHASADGHGVSAPPEVIDAFRQLEEEFDRASG